MDPRTLHIYDTTLRDGTQREGLSLSCEDKLAIARRLDDLGVAVIEGGWPGSNPKDVEFFARAAKEKFQHATIAAFGSTRRANVAPKDDPNLVALLDCGASICTIFGKSWTMQVTDVLRTTPDENLRMIEESVAFLVAAGRRVIFDAEHFFDGFRADPSYALETLKAASRGGAELVVLCDTNGGSLPWEIRTASREVADLEHPFGIHAHNDSGCAVANSLAAVLEGATQVQGTINGYGERCGNANLCSIIPDLELKLAKSCVPPGAVAKLSSLARFVAEVANLKFDDHLPYVGRSAFSHKGGVHVAAIRRQSTSYNHIDPAEVGNRTRVVVSELSGRGNIADNLEQHGLPGIDAAESADLGEVVQQIKENEARGFSYEAAEASVAMLATRRAKNYAPPFHLIDYMVTVQHREGRGTFSEATVKIEVAGETIHTAAEGNGPVSALDSALRKALEPVYPTLVGIKLVDYKVRIIDSRSAASAITRVLIQTSDGKRRWGTVGASQNIIEASWSALRDAIEYGLLHCAEVASKRALP